MPQFLNTCEGVTKRQATNLGVELVQSAQRLLERILGVVLDYYRNVPILVITRDAEELGIVYRFLQQQMAGGGLLLREGELQWLSERDEKGVSLQHGPSRGHKPMR